MKKCSIAVLVALAFAVAALMGTAAIAQDTKSGKVADSFKIKDPAFKKYTKSAVEFTHKKHSVDHKLACTECHHVLKDGKNVFKDGDKVQKCSACHTSPVKNQGKLLSAKNAFHKNCKDCHKAAKKGPAKCNECHPK
ncbi:MAG: cytochrome c family protein [Proteobacteria bacterium]|nr:cytochrome c family protein [Pseudomonadota bacterium]MBU1451981.1 cytochrome c family protein [Pseudomonadota bacterium]MBU2468975.1 cytochrome c family protein [Pseudomonadota bacterium]MBU2517696.1 cytochrome c family protein [Pseudomonadota bacterium]